ncbi:MAG: putative signal transducing protein, partial [Planctomycetota bacterium]
MEEYVEVFTASDITFAYLMKSNLESARIPVQINNENLQGAYCLDGMVPSVLVPASHVEHAKQIIKAIHQSSQNGMSEPEHNPSGKKGKVSVLAIASLV